MSSRQKLWWRAQGDFNGLLPVFQVLEVSGKKVVIAGWGSVRQVWVIEVMIAEIHHLGFESNGRLSEGASKQEQNKEKRRPDE